MLLFVCLVPGAGYAQVLPEGPITTANGTVTITGEVSATFGGRDVCPPDASAPPGCKAAYFNYTDYEHNALRMFRVSVAGMWRPTERVAFLTELRSEDTDHPIPYAMYVRVRPFANRNFDIQAGRIPPVFGAFARRSYGSDKMLIGLPLAYQYLTSLRPDAIPATADDLLKMRGRGWLSNFPVPGATPDAPGVPIISSYRWDTGIQGHWGSEYLEGAVAVTAGTLSSPRVHDDNRGLQVSGRVAWHPVAGLIVGASASSGEFLTKTIEDRYEPILGQHSYTQRAIGTDAEYSRGYWIVRGEYIDSRWNLPILGLPAIDKPLHAYSGFVETRYRFTPRYFAAMRADTLTFNRIQGEAFRLGRPTFDTWDAPVTRLEAGGGVYLQRNLTFRLSVQFNKRDGGFVRQRTFNSAQLVYWF
jgi:hypothetical protein